MYVNANPITFFDLFGFSKDLTQEIFDKLLSNYPTKNKDDFVQDVIRRSLDEAATENTCTLRLSYAMNKSGENIPTNASPELISIGWEEKEWFAFRTREIKLYLEEVYGIPISIKNQQEIQGMQGIIFFDIPSGEFGNADINHVDLWDGSKCQSGCYWNEATEGVYFWKVKKPEQTSASTPEPEPTPALTQADPWYVKTWEWVKSWF